MLSTFGSSRHDGQGGSENVTFVMHALHATLVHRGVFDEIVCARLPPDHSHDAIDRFFFGHREMVAR
eukprot:4463425-Pleurochrysis_carterae.AAC.1